MRALTKGMVFRPRLGGTVIAEQAHAAMERLGRRDNRREIVLCGSWFPESAYWPGVGAERRFARCGFRPDSAVAPSRPSARQSGARSAVARKRRSEPGRLA